MDKHRILIADDNEINRLLINEMLQDEYEIIEAKDGEEAISAIQNNQEDIDLMLLDLHMPKIDGITVLEIMNKNKWIRDIPVIIISAENSFEFTKKAFDLGVEDFISRPFDAHIVSHRIKNVIKLHATQKQLIDEIAEQFHLREHQNDVMVSMLSNIVENRNGESGAHVLHINIITGLLLDNLKHKYPDYKLSENDIEIIKNASSFHDVGKIAIPSEILNKPGKLTKEEYETMKQHSSIGTALMDGLKSYQNEPIVKYAREICNWHHERWDGKGYPDGLKADQIPISAQVVSLADVYDALTSKRCYKEAFSHEESMRMILNGECGTFNPILIECLKEIAPTLKETILGKNSDENKNDAYVQKMLSDLTVNNSTDVTRNIRMLRDIKERQKVFINITSEPWVEYYNDPPRLFLNPAASKLFNLPEQIADPINSKQLLKFIGENAMKQLRITFSIPHGESQLFDFTIPDKKIRFEGQTKWETQQDGIKAVSTIVAKVTFVSQK